MNKICTIFLFSILILSASNLSFAESKIYNTAFKTISSNAALSATLRNMGYKSTEDAVKAFVRANELAEQVGLDTNLGTLAICGEVRMGALLNGKGLICTTLFRAYLIGAKGAGVTLIANAALGSVYFRVESPKEKKHCFDGGKIALAYGLSLGIEGAQEYNCADDNRLLAHDAIDYLAEINVPVNYKKGFFAALSGGYGVGLDLSDSLISVSEIANYWE